MAPTCGSCAPRLTSHLRLLPVTSTAVGPGLAGLPCAAGGHGERADGAGSKHAGAPCPACPAVHLQSASLVGQAYFPAFAYSLQALSHASTCCHVLHLFILHPALVITCLSCSLGARSAGHMCLRSRSAAACWWHGHARGWACLRTLVGAAGGCMMCCRACWLHRAWEHDFLPLFGGMPAAKPPAASCGFMPGARCSSSVCALPPAPCHLALQSFCYWSTTMPRAAAAWSSSEPLAGCWFNCQSVCRMECCMCTAAGPHASAHLPDHHLLQPALTGQDCFFPPLQHGHAAARVAAGTGGGDCRCAGYTTWGRCLMGVAGAVAATKGRVGELGCCTHLTCSHCPLCSPFSPPRPPSLRPPESFRQCPLFIGGPVTKNLLHVLHGRRDVEGALEIIEVCVQALLLWLRTCGSTSYCWRLEGHVFFLTSLGRSVMSLTCVAWKTVTPPLPPLSPSPGRVCWRRGVCCGAGAAAGGRSPRVHAAGGLQRMGPLAAAAGERRALG